MLSGISGCWDCGQRQKDSKELESVGCRDTATDLKDRARSWRYGGGVLCIEGNSVKFTES